MTTSTLPQDPETLNELYNATLKDHQEYLEKLHKAFDEKCETIRVAAQAKLKAIPESDPQSRDQVVQEEKAQLNQVLAELKQVIQKSGQDARRKLEEIENKLEGETNIEKELNQI